jgi:hypothetical protein
MGPQTHDFEGANLAAAVVARDSYFTSNPSHLATYDSNSDLLIRLVYTDVELTTKFMQRLSGQWVDITPVVQGPNGEVVSLVDVPIGEIPYKKLDGTFGGSNMRVLEDGSILAPPGFTVESGSVTFGEALTLAEVSGYLGITNHINGNMYTVIDFFTPPSAVSSEPHIFYLTAAQFEFVAQAIDTTNIPDNPLIFNYTIQNTARSHSLKFRTYAAMSNVRAKISLVSNGVALKYFPNRQAWEEGFGGSNWVLGDNVVPFGDSPLNLEAGMLVKFEIYADVIALKGNASSIPYFSAMIQPGVFIDVITDNVYTASDIKGKLETLSSPNKLAKTAIQDSVLTVNGDIGDVVVSTTSIGAQPVDATLTALAGQTTAANGLTYSTGVDTFAQTVLTPFARTILDDTSDAQVRGTLNLGDVATRNVDVANGIATLDGTGKLTQMPSKSDVGLANVDNTSDVNKPVSTAQTAAITASLAAHTTALDPHPQYTTAAEASLAAPVQSVAGKSGIVTLVTGDIPEATNLYYTDARVGSYLTTNGYNVKSVASSGSGSSVYNTTSSGVVTVRAINGTGLVTVTQNTNDITVSTPNVTSGVYTPVLTSVANILSSAAFQCQWMRVGNTVSVSGKITIDPTSNGAVTKIALSLPVASNFGAEEHCSGTSACWESQQSGIILGDAASDKAQMWFLAQTSTIRDHFFTFTYTVI